MKNILIITSDYPEKNNQNIYCALVTEFLSHGHSVDVLVPLERKTHCPTNFVVSDMLRILRIKTLNFRGKVSLLEKGIFTLVIGYIYRYAVSSKFHDKRYDLVIYATLPISYGPVLKYLKKRDNSYMYLLHKDYFPQSAVDLGMFSMHSFLFNIFRRIEKQLYSYTDKIGVMSPKGIEYITTNNPEISRQKIEICPNSTIPSDWELIQQRKANRRFVREQYEIPPDSIVFIFGGNISRAQGISFIISLIPYFSECPNAFFLFIGSGNGYENLSDTLIKNSVRNVKLIPFLPKNEYNNILAASDVGLVFLDWRFTIPNFPSRTLSYLDFGMPILAAVDNYTDYSDFLVRNDIGKAGWSNNPIEFISLVKSYLNEPSQIYEQGLNARKYFLEHLNVSISYQTIIQHCK